MYRRIYRSRKEKMIGGVAGGLADYFNVDPVIIRLAFVALFFMTGIGLIVYLCCLVIIPKEELRFNNDPTFFDESKREQNSNTESRLNNPGEKSEGFKKVLAIILICVGLITLAGNFYPHLHFHQFLPLVLIFIGGWLLLNGRRKGKEIL